MENYERKNKAAAGTNYTIEQVIENVKKEFSDEIHVINSISLYNCRKKIKNMEDFYCYPISKIITYDDYVKNKENLSEDEFYEYIEKEKNEYIKKKTEFLRYCVDSEKYGYLKRIVNKDNQKNVFNTGNHGRYYYFDARVPSLKRSDRVWRNFYELFPEYRPKTKEEAARLKRKFIEK
jgi:predicted metal-binding transcription factor (methanogenesis marker protein 9)